MMAIKIIIIALALSILSSTTLALELNMPIGVTEVSRDIYRLHMLIFFITVAIGVVVFGIMFYSMVFHHKSRGQEPAKFRHNTKLELFWTIVATLILVVLAWPSTVVLIDLYDTGGEDLTIEVKAYQWKWQYKYLDKNWEVGLGSKDKPDPQISFFSNISTSRDEINNKAVKGEYYLLEVDEPLVIPIKKKVRFLLTSNDVIHAFWVPDFAIKRDAVPGFVNDIWTRVDTPGIYRGQCTELCGNLHGYMPIVVNAVTEDEFNAWYAKKIEQQNQEKEILNKDWTAEELYARGEDVYLKVCAVCHQPNGQGLEPVFPALKGSPMVAQSKEDYIDIVYNGQAGTAMQSFREQLNPVDMAAVIHYERNAWGNNSGDVTKPVDIVEFAKKQATKNK